MSGYFDEFKPELREYFDDLIPKPIEIKNFFEILNKSLGEIL